MPDLEGWLAISHRLAKVDYGVHVRPRFPAESALRNDFAKFLPGRHRVPTVGYLFSELRHKLVDDLIGRAGDEIAALRSGGAEVTRVEETPLLAYPGDCGVEIFDAAPELFQARVLLIECSFLGADDQNRPATTHTTRTTSSNALSLFGNERRAHHSPAVSPAEIFEALGAAGGLAERFVPSWPDDGRRKHAGGRANV